MTVAEEVLEGELLPREERPRVAPEETIYVYACPHPLRFERVEHMVAGRHTLQELLELVQPDPYLRAFAHISIDDRLVEPDLWRYVTPKVGHIVTIRVIPAGGDDNKILRSVLLLGVSALGFAVVSGAFAFGAAIEAGTGLTAGGFLTAGSLSATIASTAIGIVGRLLVNALVPPPTPKLESFGGSARVGGNAFFLQGTRNAPQPFGVIPKILGKHRMVPPLGALTFTEVQGDDQFLNVLLVWGYGPLRVTDIRIGDTPVGNFEGVTIQTLDGSTANQQLSQFPRTILEEPLSVVLYEDTTAQATGAWSSIRTTQDEIDAFSVDFTFPQGLFILRRSGGRLAVTLTVEVEYRIAGSGAGFTRQSFNVTAQRADVVRRGFRIDPGAKDRYEVRTRVLVIQFDFNSERTLIARTVWTVLRSIINEDPITFDQPIAKSAIRIKATDQLNGIPDRINGLVSSIVPDWNGSAWIERETQNPASLYREVLQGPGNARPKLDSEIDLAALQDWHEANTAEGFKFNMIVDFQSSVREILSDIASAGRASPSRPDGRWSIVVDDKRTVPVQHFSPRNSWNFVGKKDFALVPHAFRVEFNNEEKDYVRDERFVFDDGFSASNATRIERLELPGITSPDLVWRHGRFHIAQARLRPETFNFFADVENLVATRGDLIRFTHDVPLFGITAGRIKAVNDNGTDVTDIDVDEAATMEAGKSYSVRIRTAANASVLKDVDTVVGENTNLVFSTPFTIGSEGIAAGDLFLFGEKGTESVELKILSIEPGRDGTARIVCQEAAPGIQDADTGPIPGFDSKITRPFTADSVITTRPKILSVISDENALFRTTAGDLVPQVIISLVPVPIDRALITGLQAQWRIANTGDNFRTIPTLPPDATTVTIDGVTTGDVIEFRLRYLGDTPDAPGAVGAWTALRTETVIGKGTPPPNVINARVDGNTLAWTLPSFPLDLDGFLVRSRFGTRVNWSDGQPAHEGVLTESVFDIRQLPAGLQTIMIKAVDTEGNESVSPGVVKINLGDPVLDNILFTEDHEALGWPGTITGGSVVGTDIEADSTTLFWSQASTGTDFKIQRGQTTLPQNQSSITLTAGTDYEKPSTPSSAFIRLTNTLNTSGGEAGDVTAGAEETVLVQAGDITKSVTFTRKVSTGGELVLAWEIIEYVGPDDGPNEFVVRSTQVIPLSAATTQNDGEAVPDIDNDADVVVWLTGQQLASGSDLSSMLMTTEWIAGSDVPRVQRVDAAVDAAGSVAVIEFVGKNWKIQYVPHTFTGPGTETETITVVGSVTRAFLHTNLRTASNSENAVSMLIWLSADDEISYQLEPLAGNDSHTGVAWVIENTQTIGTPMRVQQLNGAQVGSADTGSAQLIDVSITPLIAPLVETSIGSITGVSSGTGSETARILVNARLIDLDTVELRRVDHFQTLNWRFEVVQWPQATVGAEALFWDGDPTALFWVADFTELFYDVELLVDRALTFPVRLTLTATVQGSPFELLFRTQGSGLFWPDLDATIFWDHFATDEFVGRFWPTDVQQFRAWPGFISVPAPQVFDMRVRCAPGTIQGVIDKLTFNLDVPDVIERFDDIVLTAGGTALTITKTFREIKNVSVTLQDDGGDAESVKIIDKKLDPGPTIRAFDSGGTGTSALIDAIVQGF